VKSSSIPKTTALIANRPKPCEYEVIENPEKWDEMIERSNGGRTVPQIFIGDTHVGGAMDMFELDKKGGLDPLLAPFLKRLAHNPTAA